MSYADRRQRIHELVVALIHQQSELDLLDGDHTGSLAAAQGNPAGWLEFQVLGAGSGDGV